MTITRQLLQDVSWLFIAGAVLFAGLAWWTRRRGDDPRRQLVSAGACAAITAVLYAAAFTVAPNIPAPAVPFYARFQTNPVPDTQESIDAGRRVFQANCVVCHGPRGLGDGPAAFTLTPRPANLQVHVPLHAEGELHYWIANGVPGTAMPAWAKKEPTPLSDTEIWQTIRFLQALVSGRVPQ